MLLKTLQLKPPVAVVRLFLFSLFGLVFPSHGMLVAEELPDSGYLVQIEAHTAVELSEILTRIDSLIQHESKYPTSKPFALVLHGDEAGIFLRKNYQQNHEIVDLAAKLEAFNAIDIQICEYWMKTSSVSQDDLPAFVNTVPYGPDQEKALLDAGYEYF